MRLIVTSKNEKKKEINMVVVHSISDAYEEANKAMENGCDESVIEDEAHNTIFSLVKEKKTHFDRITENPKALATFVHKAEDVYERCCKGDLSCDYCECQWCGLAGRKRLIDWLNEECDNA